MTVSVQAVFWCFLLISSERSQSSLVVKLLGRAFMTAEFFQETLLLYR